MALVPILLLGAFLLIVGLRGRILGSDPHCRRCGFNLRARNPENPRCPECGAELTARAIRIGVHRRRRVALSAGSMLIVLCVAGFGRWAWISDWTTWKPTSWLLADVETGTGAAYSGAVRELSRRIPLPATPQSTIDKILDRALAHQANRSVAWDPAWGQFIASAVAVHRLDESRTRRYLRQSVSVSFSCRPAAHRGQLLPYHFSIRYDRLVTPPHWMAHGSSNWSISPLMIDSTIVPHRDFLPSPVDDLLGGESCDGNYELADKAIASLPDGPHRLHTSIEMTLSQTQPLQAGPVKLSIPISAPLAILPKGAVVDHFEADPSQRDAERAAIRMARVFHDRRGLLRVALKIDKLPVAMAMRVELSQGKIARPASTLLVKAGQQAYWATPKFGMSWPHSGRVDIHLRPDQSAADMEPTLGTFWGDEIVIPGILIDAPYDAPFNRDQSLRPAVEKALQIPTITRTNSPDPRERLRVDVHVHIAPVKLAYVIVLARDGHEVKSDDPPWIMSAGKNYGWEVLMRDIDPGGRATSCDVILRPDPDWEAQSSDLTPPWGGEIIFRNVPIKDH